MFSIATRETDVLFEVLFDEEFLGGLTIRFVWGRVQSFNAIGIDDMKLLALFWLFLMPLLKTLFLGSVGQLLFLSCFLILFE